MSSLTKWNMKVHYLVIHPETHARCPKYTAQNFIVTKEYLKTFKLTPLIFGHNH